MTANPFDDDGIEFLVLANDQRQHSLWPAAIAVPTGWRIVQEAVDRQTAVNYVERNWTDMRPRTLLTEPDS